MPTDRLQADITVGDPVKVPAIVTAIGGTLQAPTLTLTTDFKNFAGANTSFTVDAIQVAKDD